MTSVYLQQTQGIGLSIQLNELLHYSMAHYMACVTGGSFKSTCPDQAWCARKLPGKRTMNIAMMRAHTAGHDITCHIIGHRKLERVPNVNEDDKTVKISV